jgi:phosphoribosyl 1,2-cyclic phosphate phosphodiesterase
MGDRLRFTILGCGSSPGTPRIGPDGPDWGACDPAEPKNRRRRASLLVERLGEGGTTVVVIDTGPDFREQMLSAGIGWADGIVYTHPHADHIHGIDELRAFVINRRRRVDVYADEDTSERLHEAFGYCFKTPPGSSYPPILTEHRIAAGERFEITGPGGPIGLLPFRQQHGAIHSLGFRVGSLVYSSDISDLPEESWPVVENAGVWVLDALRYLPHPSHFSLDEAIAWVGRLHPRRAILTHMHVDLDYERLLESLPPGIEPAYDGLALEFPVEDA